VTVQGDEISARSAGFRRIANFIFGANSTDTSISMTAPVAQSAGGSAKIAMTAPVAQTQSSTGAWVITFFMPAKYTLATLPKPLDPSVQIITVPPETYAVYRFSGIPGKAAESKARNTLLTSLGPSTWLADGPTVSWFYDPPWTLPWARRNEVAVPVKAK
jgi:hypothetical protein